MVRYNLDNSNTQSLIITFSVLFVRNNLCIVKTKLSSKVDVIRSVTKCLVF